MSLWFQLPAFCEPSLQAITFYDHEIAIPHLELIKNARSSIDLEIYTFTDPMIRNELLAAQGRGVQVRIIQEPNPVGTVCRLFEPLSSRDPEACISAKTFLNEIRARGGVYSEFNKTNLCKNKDACFQHGKIMVVDLKLALLSTGNFDQTSICDVSHGATHCNREFSLVLEQSEVVETLHHIFEADLLGNPYDLAELLRLAKVDALTVSPFSLAPLIHLIDSAQSSIQIETPYLTDPSLKQALLAASKRNVKVYLTLESICAYSKPTNTDQRRLFVLEQELEHAGIFTRAFTDRILIQAKPGALHAKALVIDQKKGWLGSVNGSTTSLTQNREFGYVFSDPSVLHHLGSVLTKDFMAPGSTSLSDDIKCVYKPKMFSKR